MALYNVDLNALAVASKRVTMKTFGAIGQNALFSYRIWVADQLSGETSLVQSAVDTAICNAANAMVVLMKTGVPSYVDYAATQIEEMLKDELPVFPVMNQDIKSDAWLTGLVVAKLAEKGLTFNNRNLGFAIDGKQAGLTAKAGGAIVDEDFKMVLIDDASYSGTQAFAILANAGINMIFNMAKFKAGALVLAGISTVAKLKFQGSPIKIHAECDPMPSFSFGSLAVLQAMRKLPVKVDRANVTKGLYAQHREVNPDTMALQVTTGEFPTFLDLTYAMPPYKIPDSLSVPTHTLMASGYKNDDTLPRVMYNARLPSTLPHLFTGSGSIDYRTTLRSITGYLSKI